jgi:hypothetical protein
MNCKKQLKPRFYWLDLPKLLYCIASERCKDIFIVKVLFTK